MAKGIGRLVSWGYAKEATRGTAQSSASAWSPWDALDFDEKGDNVKQDQAVGVIEDTSAQYRVKNYADGSFKMPLTDQSSALLLLAMFGGQSVSTVATGVYAHTFTVGESAQHPSLTFFIHDPLGGTDYSYANGVVHKLDIDSELKKFVQLSVSCRAQKGVSQSSFSPSIISENRFIPQYATFKYATSVSGLSGATPIALKNYKISINANIEDQDVLGSVAPADFLNKEFTVSGTLDAIYQNISDFKSPFLATPNVAQAMSITWANTDVTIGSASNPTLAITMPQVYFTDLGIKKSPKDTIYQSLKFEATYSLLSSYMIQAVLTNTVSGTY